mgnify:CR=1 FL=1
MRHNWGYKPDISSILDFATVCPNSIFPVNKIKLFVSHFLCDNEQKILPKYLRFRIWFKDKTHAELSLPFTLNVLIFHYPKHKTLQTT